MTNFKIVISDPKSRKAYQKEIEQGASGLRGKKIGNKVSGEFLGLHGYKLEITGGSDKDGFPMRRDVEGIARKKILLTSGVGFHSKIRGQRKRKSIRGNTISPSISQINMKVVEYGKDSVEKLLGVKKKEEKPAEKQAKHVAEERPQEKIEEKKEEKPAEKPEEKMGIKELDSGTEEKEKKSEKG